MPPRHGKTETVTKGLALWYLKHRPGCRILITGYSQRFAEKLSRDIRNLAREQGIQLAQDKFASNEWFTTENSMVMARGTGNVPTGEGFDLIIVDDPTRDAQQAASALFRDTAWDWFTQGLMTRIQPDGVVICIWTRWNEDDIAGRSDELAKEEPDADQWEVLLLKAEAETGDPLRRRTGDALWPEGGWTLPKLRNRRLAMGEYAYNALYQQNPTPKEGALFKVSGFKYCDIGEVPLNLKRHRHWDMAATEDGDYTVGVLMAGPDPIGAFYVIDVVRFRKTVHERNKIILKTAEMDGNYVAITGPDDHKDASDAFVRLLAGFNVSIIKERGSKEFRSEPVAAQVEAGNITLVRASWNRDFIEECRVFPNGKHDDQVDSFSHAFATLAKKRTLQVYM